MEACSYNKEHMLWEIRPKRVGDEGGGAVEGMLVQIKFLYWTVESETIKTCIDKCNPLFIHLVLLHVQ